MSSVNRDSFIFYIPNCIPFLALLHWIELPVQSGIEVLSTDIVPLFSNLGGKHLVFHHEV